MPAFSDLLSGATFVVASSLLAYRAWKALRSETIQVTYLPTGRSVELYRERAERKRSDIRQINKQRLRWVLGLE